MLRSLGLSAALVGLAAAACADTDHPDITPIDHQPETCSGVLTQGGLIICHGSPGTRFTMGAVTLTADETGAVAFGLDRKAPPHVTISASGPASTMTTFTLEITERDDETSVLRGINCDKIDARTEEQKAHASRSWVKKQDGWANFNQGRGALDGFIRPATGRTSSPFGYVRKYVTEGCPTRERPHFGYDIAAPTGTPIVAPAAGTVTLAENDLYYEGGTIFLDHGHGLVSIFLHMSEVDAELGDVLAAGDPIGKIGSTGRSTGAHLHWGVKWRNPTSEDRDGDFYIDPALLLELSTND
ncbi:MAG: M23 family metallopeptidase [Pseudomonadota bacterium]